MAGLWPHFSFGVFVDLDSVSVYKHKKQELGQYPAILTSHLVKNPYIQFSSNIAHDLQTKLIWVENFIIPLIVSKQIYGYQLNVDLPYICILRLLVHVLVVACQAY